MFAGWWRPWDLFLLFIKSKQVLSYFIFNCRNTDSIFLNFYLHYYSAAARVLRKELCISGRVYVRSNSFHSADSDFAAYAQFYES